MSQTFAPNAANCLLGKGKFYLKRLSAAGADTGDFFAVGEVSDGKVTPNDTSAELYSHQDHSAGLYARSTGKRKVTLTLKCHEFNRKNMALAMMGDETYYTQTGGAVTGESLASSVQLGAYYRTKNRQISAETVKQGVTTLVLGTDYAITDATAGVIQILSTSVTVTAGSAITVDYTAAAITGTAQPTVAPFSLSTIKVGAMFIGDPADGPSMEALWWLGSIVPNGDMGWIQDDYGDFTIEIDVLSDAAGNFGGSATEPYGRIIYN